jgi:8-oxo-dGTP pyrophosphatase MutT (NUDIX family)
VKGQRISGLKPIGSRLWFEYHCLESHDSSDAQLWYRSHQRVTIVDLKDSEIPAYESAYWRSYQGMPLAYTIRFADGSTFAATEDELLDSPKDFCRPDPPRQIKKGKNPPPARFWGRSGAGILFHCTGDNTYLLVLRSQEVEQPGTLGIPGGACGKEGFFTGKEGKQIGEAQAWVCAMRETKEELSWWPKQKQVAAAIVYESENFQYQTFVVDIPASEKAEAARLIKLNRENDEFIWMSLAEMAEAREQLHFGLQYVLDQIGG